MVVSAAVQSLEGLALSDALSMYAEKAPLRLQAVHDAAGAALTQTLVLASDINNEWNNSLLLDAPAMERAPMHSEFKNYCLDFFWAADSRSETSCLDTSSAKDFCFCASSPFSS